MKPFVVVTAIDFSTASDEAARQAFELAAQHARAEVHLVTVQEPGLELLPPVGDEIRSPVSPLHELAERALARFREAHVAGALERVVIHTVVGEPASEIVALAASLDADAVVVGTHGRRGLRRAILGSVAEKVVRSAGCPVFVVRHKAHSEALKVPAVEPLCAQCADARMASGGRELWCSRHAEHHVRAHVYSYAEYTGGESRPWGFAT
jgi:nucleotide-binding universal stress UspA family protein